MSSVMDVDCPNCGLVEPVRKVGVGQYRCDECGTDFTPGDVTTP